MPARKNLAGCVFGRWTVVDYACSSGQGAMWNCECECGTQKAVHASSLMSGKSVSCGCFMRDDLSRRAKRHGHNTKREGQSPTYRTWRAMLRRCNDPAHTSYSNYGGKGIRVCDEWSSFDKFLEDMGERPEGKTLDRIDGDGFYSKDNCRWMDMQEQANNRVNNHHLQFQGKSLTIAEWSRELGINVNTIRVRLLRGKSTEEALSK